MRGVSPKSPLPDLTPRPPPPGRFVAYERWEKRFDEDSQAYVYADVWAEAAFAKKNDFWAEEEHGEFVPPPWEIISSEPPTATATSSQHLQRFTTSASR